jgi:hypothetical protein
MKKARIAVVLLLGTMLASGLACGGGKSEPTPTSTPTPTAAFPTYTDNISGFSISYPMGWKVVPADELETDLAAFSAPSLCEGYLSYVVIFSSPYSSSLQSYHFEVKEILSELEGYNLISEELTVDSIPAIKLIYTHTEFGYPVQNIGQILVNEETGWNIRASTPPECWNVYEDTFNTIIDSFQIQN